MEKSNSRFKIVGAVVMGNVIEYYDFAIFGYLATVIGGNFFPSDDPAAATLASFGAFAAGALMRPIGAIAFGHLGDSLNRRSVLMLSILTMAVPTGLFALLPTYQQAGLFAPIALVLLRLVQGLSVGGEFSGSIVFANESGPGRFKGVMTAIATSGGLFGILLGGFVCYLVTSALPPRDMTEWGWRIPFALSVLISATGIYFRHGLEDNYEPPEHETSIPLLRLWRHHRNALLGAFGAVVGGTVIFYTLAVYSVGWTTSYAGLSNRDSLQIGTLVLGIGMVVFIGSGYLADRFGTMRIFRAGLILAILAAYPLYLSMSGGGYAVVLLCETVLFCILALILLPSYVLMVDIFPPDVRSTGLAISVNVAEGIVGGSMPMVLQFTVTRTGFIMSPAVAIMLGAAITLAIIAFSPAWKTLRRRVG